MAGEARGAELSGRLQSVQALRALAATLVIICHAYEPAKLGAVGVDIFFVISGFIISRVMIGRSAGEFLKDRLFRIYPIYWICALPTAALAIHIGAVTLPRTLTSLTLWPVFGNEILQPYLVVGWTLSFEMLFYLSATAALIDKRALSFFAIAYPAVLVAAFQTDIALFRFVGSPLILEFLMGVCIGRLMMDREANRPLGGLAILAAIGALCLSDAATLYLPLNTFNLSAAPERVLTWGIPAALIVWGAIQFEDIASRWRLLPYLGDASYSIYLTHGIGAFIFSAFPWPLRVAGAILFGTAIYRLIEAPLLSVRKRLRANDHHRIPAWVLAVAGRGRDRAVRTD